MTQLRDAATQTDLLNRLKRAEGQLRGIQRMIEKPESFADIASQLAAVRKALDSAHVRMTVCFMEQELAHRLALSEAQRPDLSGVLGDMQGLLGMAR